MNWLAPDSILYENFGSLQFGGHCAAFAQEGTAEDSTDDEITRSVLALTTSTIRWSSSCLMPPTVSKPDRLQHTTSSTHERGRKACVQPTACRPAHCISCFIEHCRAGPRQPYRHYLDGRGDDRLHRQRRHDQGHRRTPACSTDHRGAWCGGHQPHQSGGLAHGRNEPAARCGATLDHRARCLRGAGHLHLSGSTLSPAAGQRHRDQSVVAALHCTACDGVPEGAGRCRPLGCHRHWFSGRARGHSAAARRL